MMQLPQLILAALCILLGVVPVLGFRMVQHALEASRQGYGIALANAMMLRTGLITGLAALNGAAVFTPLLLALVLGLLFAMAAGITKLGSAPRRATVPWLCGYAREAECNRYVAHNFYAEIKRYFGWLDGLPLSRVSALRRMK